MPFPYPEKDEGRVGVLVFDVGLDESEQHRVLADEASRHEAVLLRAHELDNRLVHAPREEAREDLVVAVE